MVRYMRKAACVVMLAIITAAALGGAVMAADTHSVYDGNLSSTYTTYFRDVLANLGINDHYIYFRSGQYDYKLICGDLEYRNGVFVLVEPGTAYTISTSSSSYNSYYTYTVSPISSFQLTVTDELIYSDLGSYPRLEERGEGYAFATLFVVVVIGLCMLLRPLFNFTMRNRVRCTG